MREQRLIPLWTLFRGFRGLSLGLICYQDPLKGPLKESLWPFIVGIWGILEGCWGV